MIIAVLNNKGGVGKTCTTANLGAALALRGKKVLLVDLDSQANLTKSLSLSGDIWTNIKEDSTPTPCKVKGKLWGIGTTPNLRESELYLPQAENRLTRVKDILEPLKKSFDFVLLDNAPSLGLLAINALYSSDKVIVPLTADYLSLAGIDQINELVKEINEKEDWSLGIYYLITRYQKQRTLNREAAAFISGRFGKKVFSTRIRENVALAEAPGKGEDIFTYSPRCNGAKDYESLAKELIKVIK